MQVVVSKWAVLGSDNYSELIESDGYYMLYPSNVEFDTALQCYIKAQGAGISVTITPYLTAFPEDGSASLISVDSGKVVSGEGPLYSNFDNQYTFKGYFVIGVSGLSVGQSLELRAFK